MSLHAIIIGVTAAVVVLAVMELWSRWRASRLTSEMHDRALHPERYALEPRARLEPESRFLVRLSDSVIVCERPDGRVERVGWGDLQKVEIVTMGDGPVAPDVFWVFHGTTGGCAVPQGATGDKELLERLWALPGFDNRAFIEAMSSASDRRFVCWQRAA